MEKSVQITLIIVGAILVLALIGFSMFDRISPGRTINANGQASLEIMPDLVKVYFNAQTEGDTASEAKDKNAIIVDNLITELVKQGFERKDIQTQSFNVYPNYVWENRKRIEKGYKATHSIVVEMPTEDFDDIGKAIDAGIDAGALISYINFELSMEKQNQAKAEALKLATQDARVKAEAIAEGLGKKLGKIVSVQTQNFKYYPWEFYGAIETAGDAEQAKATTTSIHPGEQDVSASVTVVYKI